MILSLCILSYYIFSLFNLQIVNGDTYRGYADRTFTRTVPIETTRGEILDRNGEPLALNILSKSIVLDKVYMTKGEENDTIIKLVRLLNISGESYNTKVPIVVDEAGNYQFNSEKETDINSLKNFLKVGAATSAEDCMYHLNKRYSVDENLTNAEKVAVVGVRYGMELANFSFAVNYDFAYDVSMDTVSKILENSNNIPGAVIKNSSVRTYPNGTTAPHVVGVTGAINQEEYKAKKEDGYKITDNIGKSGIELSMESYLRGQEGSRSVVSAIDGTVDSVNIIKEPVPGNSVYLTIDSKLQKAAYDGLEKNIKEIQDRANGKIDSGHAADCVSGAAVVMDVKNFDVLAMVSYPSYDLSTYVDDLAQLGQDSTGPLVNRAINGKYPPGSTFKMSVGIAGLCSDAISTSTTITCNHLYTYYSGNPFQCLGWHGAIQIPRALCVSCNIFFYETARLTGIDTMNEYAKKLGLGVKTGIELPESVGIIAGREQREKLGKEWYPGDTLQAGIGQSDNLFTPLQLCTYISTIANGGTRYKTHIVKEVTDYNRENVVMEGLSANPEVVDKIDIEASEMKAVQYGMRLAMTAGSASYALGKYPVAVAGKTGTAQAGSSGSDHGLLAVYAPYGENVEPEIAIVVVLEHGLHGYSATTAVKEILDAYFYGDTEDGQEGETIEEQINSVAPIEED